MTDLHKAAEQAIFMLTLIKHATSPKPDDGQGNEDVYDAADAAITALREALTKPAVPPYVVAKDSYDKVDRFLRNNLDDADYAEYSAALDDVLFAAAPQPKDKP